ncbi:MAG: sulfoxide reductase heme-binding subunit YedZ, partial [Roseibium sp.]
AAAATAGLEYAWYALATGIPAQLVFLANFDVATSFRPAVCVGLSGAVVSLAAGGQQMWRSVRTA